MPKIFITGSADGLGLLAAKALIGQGHSVVLHARNAKRAGETAKQAPGAEDVLIGDLSSMEETRSLAAKVNAAGAFDAIIHNAGVYQVPRNAVTSEGLPLLLAVNSLAPYILTCLVHKPKRLIYMSSGMHLQGDANLDSIAPNANGGSRRISYSDTKLHNVILAMAVARIWPDVCANAVNPGWVPTKMGGAGAPDSLEAGYKTQVWLAVSNEPDTMVRGYYFHHRKKARYLPVANDPEVQDKFLAGCNRITGIAFNLVHR